MAGTLVANATMATYSVSTDSKVTDFMVTTNVTGDAPPPPYTTTQVVVLGLLAATTSVVTITGNLVVLFSFIVERSLRQPTNYFIASLAVSDLLIGVVSMPFYTIYLLAGQYWPLGEVLCDLWLSLDYTLCLSSIYTVCCITIDRFCSVRIPAKYRHWRTERRIVAVIAVVWIVPIGVFFTTIFGWQYFVGRRTVKPGKCYVQYMDSKIFNAVIQVAYFWVTLIVMFTLYAGIYRVALELQRKSEKKHQAATGLDSKESDVPRGTLETEIRGLVPSNHDTTCVLVSARPGGVDLGAKLKAPGSKQRRISENEKEQSSIGFSSDTDPSSSKPSGDKDSGANRPNPPSKTTLSVETYDVSTAASPQNMLTTSQPGRRTDDVTTAPAVSAQNIAICRRLNPRDDVTAMTSAQSQSKDGVACSALGFLYNATTENFRVLRENTDENTVEMRARNRVTDAASTSSAQTNPSDVFYDTIESLGPSATPIDLIVSSEHDRRSASLDISRSSSPIWVYRPDGERNLDWEGTAGHGAVKGGRNGSPSDRQPIGGNRTCEDFQNGVSCDLDAEGKDVDGLEIEKRHQQQPEHQGIYHQNQQGVDVRRPRRRNTDQKAFDELLLGTMARWYHRCRDYLRQALCGIKTPCKKSKREDRARKALRTITIIMGAFVFCWTPWHVLSMIMGFCPACVWPVLYDVSYWLCYLNSPINPFCYAFANHQFKKTFVRMVRLDWHKT